MLIIFLRTDNYILVIFPIPDELLPLIVIGEGLRSPVPF